METLALMMAGSGGGPLPDWFKDGLNLFFGPITYTLVVVALFLVMMYGYRIWTRPWIATTLLVMMGLFFILAFPDYNFQKIVSKPDNIPIVSLIFLLGFFIWWAFRQADLSSG